MKDLFGNKIKKKRGDIVYRDFTGEPTLRVLSLGAGVQSSTLLYKIWHGELPSVDAVIFSDTGWEPRRVYDHLATLRAGCEERGIKFYQVSAGNIREDALASKNGTRFASMPLFTRNLAGGEGRLTRQCTKEYKLEAIVRQVRRLLGAEKGQRIAPGLWVEQWIGISTDEIYRMKDSGYPYIKHRWPLIELGMNRDDCIQWCLDHGYTAPPKSSCIGCPFHDNAFWQDMKESAPDEFADACDFDEQVRNGLRGVEMPAYLHRSLIPLADVDFTKKQEGDSSQLSIFADECEGMCGV